MNPTVILFIAGLWDKFKQKNPIAAFAIFLACTLLVAASVAMPDYGIGLPKWFSSIVIIATTLLNGMNGSRTSQILSQDK